jgi:hypothetical protein
MFESIVKCWLDKCDTMNSKEKASLLEATQKAFFKEASTKAAAAAAALALEESIDETQMDSVIADNRRQTQSSPCSNQQSQELHPSNQHHQQRKTLKEG